MGLHRCSCEKSGVTQPAEYPRAMFVLAPPPCLMFVPKSSESELFGTTLPSGCQSARNSARFAVDTTADFFADFLAALAVALAAPDVRTSHTLGIRLAGLRRPVT